MAKIVKGELQIVLDLTREGSEVEVACSAHYEVTADEYGMSMRKGCPIELTATQKTAIENFAKQVIQKVKQHEDVVL